MNEKKKKQIKDELEEEIKEILNRNVLLKGGFKGTIVGYASFNGFGDITSYKINVDNIVYEVSNYNIIGVEYGMD